MTATATPMALRSPLPAPACGSSWVAICGSTSPSRCRLAIAHPITQAVVPGFCFRCRTPSSSVRKERRRAVFRSAGTSATTAINVALDGTSGKRGHCHAPRNCGPREKCQMNRFLLIGAAALCAWAIMPTLPAAAMPVSPLTPVAAQTGDDTVLVRGGHGHGHMGHGGRGHHYGWGRGRGHHYGWSRGRHRGWS